MEEEEDDDEWNEGRVGSGSEGGRGRGRGRLRGDMDGCCCPYVCVRDRTSGGREYKSSERVRFGRNGFCSVERVSVGLRGRGEGMS